MENYLVDFEDNDTNNDDHNVDVNELVLEVGRLFNDWNHVQAVVDLFAKQNGFVANKNYLYHDSSSNKKNCKWEVGFYLRKNEIQVRLTKLKNEHNHICNVATIKLALKNLRLPQEILNKIEHYTTNDRLGAGQQYDLLVKKFSQHDIKKKNLYNMIQKFKGVRQCDLDPDYVVIPRLEGPSNELTAKTNRYKMALSLFVGVDNNFKTRVIAQALINDIAISAAVHLPYPQMYHMLCIYHLLENVKKKAKAKLRESIFGIIKKHVDHGTLLKELVNTIEQDLKKEVQYTRITDYYGSNPSVGLVSIYNTIFKELDSVLKAKLAPITDIIKQLYDTPQIRLLELMTDIPSNALKELWEYRVFIHLNNAMFHISLFHTRWFDSSLSDTMNFITISQGVKSTMTIPLHYINQLRPNNVYTSTIREYVNKKVQFGSTIHKKTFLPPSMSSAKAVEQETFLSPSIFSAEVVELAFNFSPKKNELQTALKSFARNRNIKKVEHEGVRDYYDYKSAKRPDGNNNIGYMFVHWIKQQNRRKTFKRKEATLCCYYLRSLNTSRKVAEFTNKMQPAVSPVFY
ncbi:hypothetical protein C2G38_2217567 [Gigaspora rosea]|uniref:MULE transposase domain-containing protein n=1 Tax=Gigaspora rosea TaxID=44941 RepID=A0A397U7V7_9GLOM|nr:hypothetical protein C2G38_2217567 [Gigaspora rosea]